MRIGYLLLGFLFLFEPTVGSVDILPNVIGYAFIYYGIAKLADLDVHILSAKKKFSALLFVAAGQFAAMLLSFTLDSTWRLIFAFSLSVLEMIYAVPAFVSLFYGISYLETRHTDHRSSENAPAKPSRGGVFDKTELSSGTAYFEVFQDKNGDAALCESVTLPSGTAYVGIENVGFSSRGKEKKKSLYASDEARVASVIFVIIHALCAVLPEFTAIFGTKTGYTPDSALESAGIRTVLIVVLGIVSLIFGVLWLIRMVRYFNGFRRDEAFLSALSEKYRSEVETDTLLLVKRKTRVFGRLSVIALFFLSSLQISGLYVAYERLEVFFFLPEFMFGVLMCIAFYLVREHLVNYKAAMRRAALFILPSAVSYVGLIFYALRCGGYAFPYRERGFLPIYLVYMGGFILATVLFICLLPAKKRVYRSMARTAADLFSAGLHEMAERKREESFSSMAKKIYRLTVAEYIYAAVSILCMAAVPFANEFWLFDFSWLIRAAFTVGLMISEAKVTGQIQYELERVM